MHSWSLWMSPELAAVVTDSLTTYSRRDRNTSTELVIRKDPIGEDNDLIACGVFGEGKNTRPQLIDSNGDHVI